MRVPSYREFIEPVLRVLAEREGVQDAAEVHEAAARRLGLDPEQFEERLSSGTLAYKNRAGWAFNALKHGSLAKAEKPAAWELTAAGRAFAAAHGKLSKEQISALADAAKRSKPAATTVPPVRQRSKSSDSRKAYRLPPRPFASGGQAEVFEAVRKVDQRIFVLKRALGERASQRMRREIEVQRSLSSPHVMPIVDWDSEKFRWYVMPKGARPMSSLDLPIAEGELVSILLAVLAALDEAHSAGHPHRDVKPGNIIEVPDDEGTTRWVLADWGLTRRPLGETTEKLTHSGHLLGTEGFAAPEAYTRPHELGPAADIFSLGQVISWALGGIPIPNQSAVAPEPWTELVAKMTRFDEVERLKDATSVREMLLRILPRRQC